MPTGMNATAVPMLLARPQAARTRPGHRAGTQREKSGPNAEDKSDDKLRCHLRDWKLGSKNARA